MGDNFSAGNYEQFIEQLSEDEKIELIVHLSLSLKNGHFDASQKTPRKKGHAAKKALTALAKPMRKALTLEDLIREQNYQGGDQKRFDRKADTLNIPEPIEDLLARLGA